ncbi:hypothetical protein FVEG_17698 [Fusarium verticillioides 7600]|uniref:Uncharacterized protein n=1 Tax=Gibberella moniliformis (strain M3125 / FGSC 7600) TaxID=334819 RepID=A0A139YC41_GIBM7|nr:hypothetical protein FVEG_17698 [Fusarium verticillioides 7600]KYG13775.1 hypothetical protein FVEG_17698 [Fusarium verticillioides 7600]
MRSSYIRTTEVNEVPLFHVEMRQREICNTFPVGGQQPVDIDYIIISLSSGEESEFPASDFMENHAVPSARIRNPSLVLRKSAEVNDGSLPLDPPPDINDSDMDPPDVTLEREDNVEEVERHPDIQAWIGFADDSWPTSSQH